MTDISKQISELSPSKRALFETLLQQKRAVGTAAAVAAAPEIAPDRERRYEPFPLTDMQQAYWVGRSGAFNLGMATHMYEEVESTELDLLRLEKAWQQLVQHHDMLRAIFLPDGRQQILEAVPAYSIAITDVRGLSPEDVQAHFEEVRDRMSHQVLPADRWPLFELHASRLGEKHYRVHISIDGLLLDGWSYQLLFHEWLQRYQDPDSPAVPLEISFRDYVLAELALRDSEAYKRCLAYWRDRLSDLPLSPDLPLARKPETLSQPRVVRRKASLAPDIWNQLKTRASQAGLSPSGAVLAAYTEVLSTWSKSPRFTLNVPRFNRLALHPQINDIIGEFASFTLLEVDNTDAGTFESRARRQQEQLWRDLDYSQVSGVQVLRELNRIHGRSAEALMPIVFTIMPHTVDSKGPTVSLALADQAVFGLTQTSQTWLDCQSGEDAGALVFNWDSVDELFPAGMLDDMFNAFCRFLNELAVNEQVWQQDRPQLVPGADLDLIAQVNATETPMPDVLLHELFAARAQERPNQPALVARQQVLTYADLAARAKRLARQLRQSGVRPNTLVAVVMEKGPEQVIAVLSTLFAGGAYLPVDPSLPQERFEHLLNHGEVHVALTQAWLEDRLPWPEHIERVAVDVNEKLPEEETALEPLQTPDDLAYVIYTSGSTGEPKGAMIGHRGVVNAVLATNREFKVGPDDRIFALTALHHDMSVFDIFGALAAGATIVMPNAESTRDPAAWIRTLASEKVTIWNSVPAFMEMLVEYASAQNLNLPDSLRLAFLGGDWIQVTLPARARALASGLQIVSVGGPTETTLWNIWFKVEQVNPGWQSIPYGKPIANNRYYVLNRIGRQCPIWVPGVLCCAGAGVAKGYWRDERRTQESFPIDTQTGERIYRTGDLGRLLPDGTLEFLGREDFQVKIQGMRVELGDIEAALMKHRLVRSAVVTLAGETAQSKQLVAHVVLNDAEPSRAAAIDDFIEEEADSLLENVLLEPQARLEFKLKQHGLRMLSAGYRAVELAKPPVDDSLLKAYAARRSYRAFQPESVPFQDFSAFLSCLGQVHFENVPVPKYLYPSGGGLYPVQTYVYIQPDGVEGLAAGVYYYSPRENSLILMDANAVIERDIHITANQPIFDDSAFSIFLVADMDAITPMYGKLSRDFCLLEAGYMGQTLLLAGPPQRIGLCPVGSIRFAAVRDLFLLNENHVLLHSMIGGKIAADQILPSGFAEEISEVSARGKSAHRRETEHAIIPGLQAFLKQKLPVHMVPSSIKILDSLPLTPNGKIDRKALASEARTLTPAAHTFAPPRNALEFQIAEIWRSVLHSESVGINDNFFELGGNSLQLVQIHSILQQDLKCEISVVDLFQYPTISALAQMLSSQQNSETSMNEPYQRGEMRAQLRREGRDTEHDG